MVVQVAEQRLLERFAVGAGLAMLGSLKWLRAHRRGSEQRERGAEDDRAHFRFLSLSGEFGTSSPTTAPRSRAKRNARPWKGRIAVTEMRKDCRAVRFRLATRRSGRA